MTRVYGSCIEPGGMLLNNETHTIECPECGALCPERLYETCDGSINQRFSISCAHCGFHDCNAEVCEQCEEHFTPTLTETSDLYLDVMCSVTTLTEALVFLAKMEGSLLTAKAMLKFGDSIKAREAIFIGQMNYENFITSSLPKTTLLASLISSVSSLAVELAPIRYKD